MAWFERRQRGLSPQKRKEIPKGLWVKCDKCDAMLYKAELERDFNVCAHCGYHFKIGHQVYISLIMDPDTFEETEKDLRTIDPLEFKEKENYPDYMKRYQKRTGMMEAVVSGTGRIEGRLVSLSIHDGSFLAGSMGSVVGEKVTRSIRRSLELKIPLLVVATSGGARMQEGILSLMQMAKTSLWLNRLSEEKIPFVVVITNPTMAGVMASYASLGDFHPGRTGRHDGLRRRKGDRADDRIEPAGGVPDRGVLPDQGFRRPGRAQDQAAGNPVLDPELFPRPGKEGRGGIGGVMMRPAHVGMAP